MTGLKRNVLLFMAGFCLPVPVWTAESGIVVNGRIYGTPKAVGRLQSNAINECSGLAASRIQPVIWVHNDSGDKPCFYALKGKGELAASFQLKGATAVDWEDMAIGPHPKGGSVLFFGDIGDNQEIRKSIRVYRVPEPKLNLEVEGPLQHKKLKNYDYVTLKYPDRPHNAEALAVDPEKGDIYIITKERKGLPMVFCAPAPAPWKTVVMKAVGPIPLKVNLPMWSQVTAADVSPDGKRVLLRTYGSVLLLTRPPGEPLKNAFKQTPSLLPVPTEMLGEAIGFSASGRNYYTISEGNGVPVYRIDSKPAPSKK